MNQPTTLQHLEAIADWAGAWMTAAENGEHEPADLEAYLLASELIDYLEGYTAMICFDAEHDPESVGDIDARLTEGLGEQGIVWSEVRDTLAGLGYPMPEPS